MRNDAHTETGMERIKKDFFMITGIAPSHLTNKIEYGYIRRDNLSKLLAEKVFEQPKLLTLLIKKIKHWLKLEKSEFTYALAGHICYLNEDYRNAERYFLKAIGRNYQNLDNWFDLAFSLYHQDSKKNKLAKKILFNFDYCVNNLKDRMFDAVALEKAFSSMKKCSHKQTEKGVITANFKNKCLKYPLLDSCQEHKLFILQVYSGLKRAGSFDGLNKKDKYIIEQIIGLLQDLGLNYEILDMHKNVKIIFSKK
ncbi:MAG: hypothetical protein COV72_06765 [Candidatus Omnitrophica bacterium CG11_big_fil_rev_8_21_14_0_20_42_13]|uniref:Uncharacterized protein n=1 Tax=Candidatus Ghiorseimicrobium undicola TaxID=1974746 RepID=A0A2H0LWF9_9BACT|nr:MAG: hypothetical protein COV72_06765 [Candidatus Omnitrophica bacterium CG11_big_fil_rev_8_21_14_0_20_42_13]